MPSYLVERYLPASRSRDASTLAELRAADVRHVRATFVPEDETCFDVVEAPSREAVREALERAAIAYERIVEAVE
jgi:Nickel responsive protein SCO4226-like